MCVMYTTSALWAPCKARDGHRSRVGGSGCSPRLLQHLQGHQAGPAPRGRAPGEPQSEQTDPARVTRCWPVLCCPTPSCCCSPPWGKELGMRHGLTHRSKGCTPVITALGNRSFQRDVSTSCSWGRFLLICQHFTPSLWELGLGKQVSPSLTPPPTGPGGFLDKPQCVPTRLVLPPRTPPRAVLAA